MIRKMSTKKELSTRFNDIVENQEILNQLDDFELQELRVYLSKKYQKMMSIVLNKVPLPLNPKSESFKKILLSNLDDNGYNAPFVKHFILRIDKLQIRKHLEIFDGTIFLNIESQLFFNYIFNHWLIKETTINYLHFVFRKFWIYNDDEVYYRLDNYIITCSFKHFANNWNKKYLRLCSNDKLRFKSFKFKGFSDIGLPVCDLLDKKFNALEHDFIQMKDRTLKQP